MRRRAAIALAFVAFVGSVALADVKLPAILGSNMVLQQGREISIWGTADAGEQVSVALGDAKQTTQAGDDGKWRVKLPPQKAGGPVEIIVAGKNTIKLANVLIGEVWVCSGQSNMAMSVRGSFNAKEEIAAAKYPRIRLFAVRRKTAPDGPQADCEGSWTECSPKTVPGFSAVGYYFGRKLRQELKVPVGLINSSWGGTPAESWTEASFLQGEVLTPILDRWQKVVENHPKALEAYKQKLSQWEQQAQKIRAAYQVKLKAWQAQQKALKAAPPKGKAASLKGKAAAPKAKGKTAAKLLPKPKQPRFPRRPRPPLGRNHPHYPSSLYNGMIHPLLLFPIQGAIWYQGESNAGRARQYRTLLPAMVKSWRKAWGDDGLDFYTVQLANFLGVVKEPPAPSDNWAELREAQVMTCSLPKTGLACIIDIGAGRDIHPKNKQDVGLRLALAALAQTYGRKIVYSGPMFDAMTVAGNAIRVKFKHVGGGLVAKPFTDPVTANGPPLATRFGFLPKRPRQPKGKAKAAAKAPPAPAQDVQQWLASLRPKSEVLGFAIAGEDKKFVWAEARIDGDTVVVTSPQVPKPVAVRYAFETNPICNLYNQAGLPAVPFRSDGWPGVTDGKR